MSSQNTEVTEILSSISERIIRMNFQQRQKHVIFTFPAAPNVIGWLGLNRSVQRCDSLLVNPVVGVRHQLIESRVASLSGLPEHRFIPPTISRPLAQLAKNPDPFWMFKFGVDPANNVENLVNTVKQVGLPFIMNCICLNEIYAFMQNLKRGTPPEQLDYRIPVAAELLGARHESLQFIDGLLSELGERSDPAAKTYRKFAEAFRGQSNEATKS